MEGQPGIAGQSQQCRIDTDTNTQNKSRSRYVEAFKMCMVDDLRLHNAAFSHANICHQQFGFLGVDFVAPSTA